MIFGVSQSKTRTLPLGHKGGDPSLSRYSSKTAEQNFMKLSGIVHYMMPYCTSYSNDFGVSQSKTRTLPNKTWGSGGYHFVSIAHSISSFFLQKSQSSYPHEIRNECIKSMVKLLFRKDLAFCYVFSGYEHSFAWRCSFLWTRSCVWNSSLEWSACIHNPWDYSHCC